MGTWYKGVHVKEMSAAVRSVKIFVDRFGRVFLALALALLLIPICRSVSYADPEAYDAPENPVFKFDDEVLSEDKTVYYAGADSADSAGDLSFTVDVEGVQFDGPPTVTFSAAGADTAPADASSDPNQLAYKGTVLKKTGDYALKFEGAYKTNSEGATETFKAERKVKVVMDNDDPTVTFPVETKYSKENHVIDVVVADATSPLASKAAVSIDGGEAAEVAVSGGKVSVDTSSLDSGTHTVTITVKDSVEHKGSATQTVTIDQTGPAISLAPEGYAKQESTTYYYKDNGPAAVALTVTDNIEVKTVVVKVNGVVQSVTDETPADPKTFTADVPPSFADDKSSIEVSATDSFDNPADVVSATLVVDTDVPTTTFDYSGAKKTVGTTHYYETATAVPFAVAEKNIEAVTVPTGGSPEGSTYSGGEYKASIPSSVLKAGEQTVAVKAIDKVGREVTATSETISVDNGVAPKVSFDFSNKDVKNPFADFGSDKINYYDATGSVMISVTDVSFDPSATVVKVTKNGASTTQAISGWTPSAGANSNGEYTWTANDAVEFTEGAGWKLEVTTSDLVGKSGTTTYVENSRDLSTIDLVAPGVAVVAQADPVNAGSASTPDVYGSDPIAFDVTVTDDNAIKKVVVKKNGAEESTTDNISGAAEVKEWKTTVSFAAAGCKDEQTFSIVVTDKAGHTSTYDYGANANATATALAMSTEGKSGNKLNATSFIANFVNLTVSFDEAPAVQNTDPKTGVTYYQGERTASFSADGWGFYSPFDSLVEISDSNADAQLPDNAAWNPQAAALTHTAKAIFPTTDGSYKLKVAPTAQTASRLTINDLAAGEAYESETFVVDMLKPKVDVVWESWNPMTSAWVEQAAPVSDGATDYYSEKLRAKVTITEAHFNPDFITVAMGDGSAATFETTASDGGPDWQSGGANEQYVYVVFDNSLKAYQLKVDGKDWANNPMDEPYESGLFVVDNNAPVIKSIELDPAQPKTEAGLWKSDDSFYDAEVEATITIEEDHPRFPAEADEDSAGETSLTITGTGSYAITQQWRLSEGTDNVYTCKVRFNEGFDNSLAVKALDWSGRSDAKATGTFVIDKKDPQVAVTFNQVKKATDPNDVDYFDATVKATIEVVDSAFDADGDAKVSESVNTVVTKNGTAQAVTWSQPDPTGSPYKWTAEVTFAEGQDNAISVDAYDKALRHTERTYTQDGAFADDEGTVLEGKSFVVDTTDPKVGIQLQKPVLNTDSGVDYFDAELDVIVTVIDDNFDQYQDGGKTNATTITKDGEKVADVAWKKVDDATWTATIPFAEGQNHTLSVDAYDWAGRMTSAAYGQKAAGNVLGTTDVDDKFLSGDSFTIDTTDPAIAIEMQDPMTGLNGSTDYYSNILSGNKALTALVTVTDDNFRAGSADTYVKVNGVNQNVTWLPDEKDAAIWTATVSVGESADNTIDVSATDWANRTTEAPYSADSDTTDSTGAKVKGTAFTLDLTAPKVESAKVTKPKANQYGTDYYFYSDRDTLIEIAVSDNFGIDYTKVNDADNYYNNHFTVSDAARGAKASTVTVQFENGQEFDRAIILETVDLAGNSRLWSIAPDGTVTDVTGSSRANVSLVDGEYPLSVIKDSVPPEITLSGPGNNTYFNTTQTVTAAVNELNFRYLKMGDYVAPQGVVTITTRAGNDSNATSTNIVTVDGFSPTNGSGYDGRYGWSQDFAADGHYYLVASFKDPALNESNTSRVGEFTIDKTAPVIQDIVFDNNDSRNGKYYKAGRTATITIVEHNWDPALATITTNGSISGWSDRGDTHTCTVSFTTDGTYNLSVSCTDKAGNSAAPRQVDEFVVDLTAPTIDFSEVVAQTAYNDVIAPVINYHDEANFDANGMEYALAGSKHGAQTLVASQSSSGNDGTVAFSDFTREVEYDDIYTLTAHLTDLAGNEADNSITFSVNRFGSNFIVLDARAYTENNGYLAEPREIRVQEVNVSGALSENHGVSVTHGLNTETLDRKQTGTAASEGFYVESGADTAGWSTYLYHIGSGNFTDDGNYHVVINSTDTATNLNNSASYYNPTEHKVADAEVSFILDTADPIIDSISVADGGLYDASKSTVSFTVTDNIGFDVVKVTLDGDTQTVEPEMGGLCTVEVPAKSFTARDMEIVATDLAGRSATATVSGFHWTTDFIELNIPLVVGLVVVVVAAAIGGVVFVRRRNGQ